MSIPENMPAEEVLRLVDHLVATGAIYQLNGGWGVDALVGTETRPHRDLDVFVDAEAVPSLLDWLAGRGYETLVDWLPVRAELGGPCGRVDVHPMVLDERGDGIQQGLDGEEFVHASADRTVGRIAGREVVVASADRQRRLRTGYALRDVDRHDLAMLDRLTARGT